MAAVGSTQCTRYLSPPCPQKDVLLTVVHFHLGQNTRVHKGNVISHSLCQITAELPELGPRVQRCGGDEVM